MDEHTWDEQQLEAIEKCCDVTRRVVPVTGQAGTGKSSLFKEVKRRLEEAGYSVGVCAPTGKAAKRLRESGIPTAQTTHALLEYCSPGDIDPKTGKPRGVSVPMRDRRKPLDYDVVLADEYAMTNQEVHRNLFDSLKPGALIRVFGDSNQLRPIEENKRLAGEPSAFTVLLEKFGGVVLKTIHRQGDGSGIIANGSLIIAGRIPKKTDDFQIIRSDHPVNTLTDYVFECLDKGVDFSSPDNQIITLGHKSWVGTVRLNTVLQNIFRSEVDGWFSIPRHPWAGDDASMRLRIGDKVVQMVNNRTLDIYNGEVGTVTDINEDEIVVNLGDREVIIPAVLEVSTGDGGVKVTDPRKDINLAYVLTTHKMQGSEAEHVVYVMNKSNAFMQNRNNFYTAITRAKRNVAVITDINSLTKAVSTRG